MSPLSPTFKTGWSPRKIGRRGIRVFTKLYSGRHNSGIHFYWINNHFPSYDHSCWSWSLLEKTLGLLKYDQWEPTVMVEYLKEDAQFVKIIKWNTLLFDTERFDLFYHKHYCKYRTPAWVMPSKYLIFKIEYLVNFSMTQMCSLQPLTLEASIDLTLLWYRISFELSILSAILALDLQKSQSPASLLRKSNWSRHINLYPTGETSFMET